MVEFKDVSKMYKNNVLALDNINFKIDEGEFVFVIGESGAGKSTLLKLILKEENPTSGELYLFGDNITKLRNRRVPILRKQIGVVFQDFRLIDNKNVYGNLQYVMEILGYSRRYIKREIPKLLEKVNLLGKEKSYPYQLSGGEQQRVSIARALIVKPKILIADEPTGNLDPKTADDIVKALDQINKEGTTVIMITHEKTIVDSMKKRVIHLEKGKIIRDEKGGKYEEN
ncbi:cell division ATP-binding protein FtsE [Miniphocaeibacter halophilus]|uniref:Cell division ATP-binding protein FtsE n=1 Tax=Miniphocaeibacter halophilus TaxID=2931922 RepID=A0AC61MW24_9FIRM|nr:cell division ATP-binding protein FtsE [Miniphocaeibacter halophilus]QQK07968.1 cell division ATP-binding protein FtsE [Miniphocaeibacter halophilus]